MDAKTLEGTFNAWAEGKLLICVEEIRQAGHNRYNVLNRLKPLITNPTIEIHPKNVSEEVAKLLPNCEFIAEWKTGAALNSARARVKEFLSKHTPSRA